MSALYSNTTGNSNTATGNAALFSNTTASGNTAMGGEALIANTEGQYNTATGNAALRDNTTGYENTATGYAALLSNTTGYWNTAVGNEALYNNTTGLYNIALGYQAGYNNTDGSGVIYIGHPGVAAEGNTIRIGRTDGTHTRFFAAGIRGVTTVESAIPVLIDTQGQLGTVSSSIRFKEDVRDMSDTSDALLQLRPVTFRYKGRPAVTEERHYGLIAEEVSEVIPELVAHSADGQVESVKYHELPAMLLNELQKQQREILELRALQEKLAAQDEEIAALKARLAQLESR